MRRILFCIAFVCSSSFAAEFGITYGISQSAHPTNGLWYQEELPYKLSLDSATAGFQVETGNWSFGYRYLGSYRTWCIATSDENYKAWREEGAQLWPESELSEYSGRGQIDGIYALRRFDLSNGLYIRGGVWVHRTIWSVDVPDWHYDLGSPKRDIHVTSNDTRFGLAGGIGYRYENFDFGLSFWDVAVNKKYEPVYSGMASSLDFTLRF